MKIKDLSPELRELAVKNYEDQKHVNGFAPEEDCLDSDINESFVFSLTPEGLDFWWHVELHGTAPENHPLHSKESSE